MTVNIKRIITGFIVALAIMTVTPLAQVQAATPTPQSSGPPKCGSGITFFPAWYDHGLCDPKTGNIVSPGSFDKKDTGKSFSKWASILAINLVSILLYAVGYISLGFIIYGGFKYMISGDNSSGTMAARKTITNAVIGLILSIMSVALVNFIANAIGGSS